MSEEQAKRVVMAVGLVVVAVVCWESIVNEGKIIPPAKTVVSLLVLLAGLSIGASLAPEIVGPLALLIGTAIAISRMPAKPGPFLTRYAGQPPTTSTPPKTSQGG